MPNQLPDDKTRTSFALEKSELARIKEIADAQGCTVTDLLLKAIDAIDEDGEIHPIARRRKRSKQR